MITAPGLAQVGRACADGRGPYPGGAAPGSAHIRSAPTLLFTQFVTRGCPSGEDIELSRSPTSRLTPRVRTAEGVGR